MWHFSQFVLIYIHNSSWNNTKLSCWGLILNNDKIASVSLYPTLSLTQNSHPELWIVPQCLEIGNSQAKQSLMRCKIHISQPVLKFGEEICSQIQHNTKWIQFADTPRYKMYIHCNCQQVVQHQKSTCTCCCISNQSIRPSMCFHQLWKIQSVYWFHGRMDIK